MATHSWAAVFSEPRQANSSNPRPNLVTEAFEAPHSAWWSGLRKGSPIAYACLLFIMMAAIIFVLFFRVMATVVVVERGYKEITTDATSPSARSERDSKPEARLSITVSEAGAVALNGEIIDDGIAVAVKRFARQNHSKHISATIHSHPSAAYDRVIDVLHALALASIKDVTLEETTEVR